MTYPPRSYHGHPSTEELTAAVNETIHLTRWDEWPCALLDGFDCAVFAWRGESLLEDPYDIHGRSVRVRLSDGALAHALDDFDKLDWALDLARDYFRLALDRLSRDRYGPHERMDNAIFMATHARDSAVNSATQGEVL